MIDSSKFMEKVLQYYRFKMVRPFLKGDVMDFGGNKGELKKYVKGNYTVVNYDHSKMDNKKFDTIVALAVIEHLSVSDIYDLFKKFKNVLRTESQVIITTPSVIAKPVLELMVIVGLADKDNIAEHKHYWNKKEIIDLAQKTGFSVIKYKRFQLGFNQFAVFK